MRTMSISKTTAKRDNAAQKHYCNIETDKKREKKAREAIELKAKG